MSPSPLCPGQREGLCIACTNPFCLLESLMGSLVSAVRAPGCRVLGESPPLPAGQVLGTARMKQCWSELMEDALAGFSLLF